MTHRSTWVVLFARSVATIVVVGWGCIASAGATQPNGIPRAAAHAPATSEVDSLLADLRRRHSVPGMAAIVVRADAVPVIAVAGVRRQGEPAAVTVFDRFHIGSNGKAIAATVIGRLVEDGELSWKSRPIDVMPELASMIDPAFRDVTLEQLLGHRSGLPAYTDSDPILSVERRFGGRGTPREQRRAVTQWLLQQPPAGAVGDALYSNAGYVVAAAMAEAVTDQPWEALVETLVAKPLGISVVWSQPARTDQLQPWGHRSLGVLGLRPASPESSWKIGPIFAPAGDLSLSPGDYAAFLQQHLLGLSGRVGVLTPETVRYLHHGPEGYSLGWGRSAFDGMPSRTHAGSEGTFLAVVGLLPEQDLAVAVLINAKTPAADRAAREAVGALLRMHMTGG